jgi:integrase
LANALEAMTRKIIKEETRKALTTLNKLLNYTLTRHFIDVNPARVLKPQDFAETANSPRDRVLTLIELRRLWLELDQASDLIQSGENKSSMSLVISNGIKLLILTEARRSEIADMRKEELRLNDSVWIIPKERTKNRKEHTVYHSPLAIELIKMLEPISNHSPFVFDIGHHSAHGHIHPDTCIFFGWVIPMIILYMLGASVGWIYRGFRQK